MNRIKEKQSRAKCPFVVRPLVVALIAINIWTPIASAADLPVRTVTLYKHGIAFFERSGTLAAGEQARLDFKESDMNDVLKSLTITDKSGGLVSGLRYEASDTLAKKLEMFPFKLGQSQAMSAVIDQLKGARIALGLAGESVTGTVVGARTVAARENQPEREQVTLLLDGGEIRVLDLSAATSVRFPEPTLNRQFQDYLKMLLDARSKDKRSVYIDTKGIEGPREKQREINVGYIAPAPVWKSSYRLIFDSPQHLPSSQPTSSQATLEGWAIVDNTTGEDWSNVRLSLVSGRPVSFISRLYEPRYVARSFADLAESRASGPTVFGGALGMAMAAPRAPAAAPAQAMRSLMSRETNLDMAKSERERVEASTIAATAAARELGELFEYRIGTPVTVRSNESAMLPFMQQKIAARKLLIYSDLNSPNPMNAAELTNSTGKTLDGGPITVFEDGGYGGEALVETFKASDKRLIAYGIDLGTRITTRFDSKGETVRELRAARGVITSRVAQQETRTYSIQNVDPKAKRLVIEHPARPGYALVGRTASERTTSAYRFEVPLAAKGAESFAVVEERVYETTTAASSLTPDAIVAFVQNKALSDAARKQLEEVGRLKEQVTGFETDIRDVERRSQELSNDQDRVRRNISSLNSVSGQQQAVQNYARQLTEGEVRMTALRDRRADLEKQRGATQQQLAGLVSNLTF